MNFCSRTADIWQIVGKVYYVFKIVVPLLLIIFGIIALSKAAISNDDKALNKEIAGLIKKIIIGIVVFLVPSIIRLGFFMITQFDKEMREDVQNCIDCLTSPYNKCDTSKSGKEVFK